MSFLHCRAANYCLTDVPTGVFFIKMGNEMQMETSPQQVKTDFQKKFNCYFMSLIVIAHTWQQKK